MTLFRGYFSIEMTLMFKMRRFLVMFDGKVKTKRSYGLLVGGLLLFFLILVGMVYSTVSAQFSLWLVENQLERKHGVNNMDHKKLRTILSSPDAQSYILFDTRAQAEYDTSRIESGIRVSPNMSAEDFMEKFGQQLPDKHLVFYCSVGSRSSEFVVRVQDVALNEGARSLANLRGGIFRWYNEGNPVVNKNGETNDIHPYDDEWGKLIIQRNKP